MADVNLNIHANIQGLKASLDQANQGVKELEKNVKDTGNEFAGTNKKIKPLLGTIEQLEDKVRRYERWVSRATNPQQIATYNKRLQETKTRLNEIKATGIENVNKSATRGITVFKQLGATIAAAFGVYTILNFVKSAMAAYTAQEEAERKLKFAIMDRQVTYKTLEKFAENMAKKTIYADEEILSSMAYLIENGRTVDEAFRTMNAAVELAAIRGVGLQEAAESLNSTFAGVKRGVSKLGYEFRSLTLEQLTNGKAVDLLIEKHTGLAEELAKSSSGQIKQAHKAWNELKELIGVSFVNAIGTAFTATQEVYGLIVGKFTETWQTLEKHNLEAALRIPNEYIANLEQMPAIYTAMFTQMSKGSDEMEVNWKELNKYATDYLLTLREMYSEADDPMSQKKLKALNDEIELRKKLAALIIELAFETEAIEIEMMKEGRERLIAEENLRQKALLQGYKTKYAEVKGYHKLVEKAEAIHQKKLAEIEDMFAGTGIKLGMQAKLAEQLVTARDKVLAEARKFKDEYELPQLEVLTTETDKFKKKLEELFTFTQEHPFWSALGLTNEDEVKMAQDSINTIISSIQSMAAAQVQAQQDIMNAINQRIGEQEQAVNRENELMVAGYANNLTLEKKKLAELQKERQKAAKDQEKAQKNQLAIEGALQAANLATSASELFKSNALFGLPGVFLAIAAIATMFSLFAKARSQASALTKYAGGGLLDGRSHARGGVRVPELGAEMEGGEFVINKASTKKYMPLIKAINDDNLALNVALNRQLIGDIGKRDGYLNSVNARVSLDESKQLSEIKQLLSEVLNKGTTQYFPGYRIEKKGSVTRKIYD